MPRYSATENQFVAGEDITVLASAARAVTGQSAAVPSEEFDTVVLELAVTAASGTTAGRNGHCPRCQGAGSRGVDGLVTATTLLPMSPAIQSMEPTCFQMRSIGCVTY